MAVTASGNYKGFETTAGATPAGSGTKPSNATDGFVVDRFDGVIISVKTVGGGNLLGTGTLDCFVYDPTLAVWARFKRGDLTVDATGIDAQTFEPFDTFAMKGDRIAHVPNGVGYAGGGSAGVTVWYKGIKKVNSLSSLT